MKIFLLIITILGCCWSLTAQVRNKSYNVLLRTMLSDNVPVTTVPEAAKNFHNYLFLDARELSEYKISHIQNAYFVGHRKFNITSISTIDKKKPVIVYC